MGAGSHFDPDIVAAFMSAQGAESELRDRSILDVDGTPMQGLIAHLSATPGSVRWSGRPQGADTAEILAELDARDAPPPA
jgi:hypothetical protein